MTAQIRTIDIKGKQYVTVAERVRLVHAEREAFEVVESMPIEVAVAGYACCHSSR